MSIRTRKLIGAVILLCFVFIYALLVMALGASRINQMGGGVQATFYIISGLAWLPFAMLIIRFMAKGDKSTNRRP